MVIREIKGSHWGHVYSHVSRFGRATPMSLQYDVDVNCNGVDYVLRVQAEKGGHRLIALQAVGVYPDDDGVGGKRYRMIDDNVMISALLEIIIFQGANRR